MTVRVKVRRDGPGEWTWTLLDEHSDFVGGVTSTWDDALREATSELELLDDLERLQDAAAAAVQEDLRARAAEFDRKAILGMQERAAREGRPWRRWLGL